MDNPLSLARLSEWDRLACRYFNRAAQGVWSRAVFMGVSRLGNGVFWYALMLGLLLWHREAACVLHMAATGLVCTLVYKALKHRLRRPRPYRVSAEIFCVAAPLDEFSFPSGHTLHAVAFSLVALHYYPALAPLVIPFTILVALSRPILGLHYPSDVLAGALIGALIAALSLSF